MTASNTVLQYPKEGDVNVTCMLKFIKVKFKTCLL